MIILDLQVNAHVTIKLPSSPAHFVFGLIFWSDLVIRPPAWEDY